jgi:hypothetical protein
VVVFTLVPSGSATIESSARIAAALSIRLSGAGTLAVKSAPADVKQADYLSAAQKLGVDYYVSGFVSPLGGGFATSLQLVSTTNGIAVWTGTATLSGTDDVADAAEVLTRVIGEREARNSYAVAGGNAPPPPGPAAPAGSATRPGGLAAAPPVAATPPRPVATPAPTPNPNAGVIVAVLDAVDSSSDTSEPELTYSSDAIAASLEKRGVVVTRWHRQVPALAVSGAELCDETKTTSLLEPTIKTVLSGQESGTIWNTVTVELVSFDCATHAVSRAASGGNGAFNWKWAADRSVADIVAKYSRKPGAGAR